jgi:hypothetical protein
MRSSRNLPTRFPDGAKYVLESHGGMVRRFVEFPDGHRVTLAARKAVACACPDLTEVSLVPSVAEAHAPRRRPSRRTIRALAHA